MSRSAAVTGLGPISSIGCDVESFWNNLVQGRAGFSDIQQRLTQKTRCKIAAAVTAIDPKPLGANPEVLARAVELALAAARLAWDDAQLDGQPADRIGLIVGTGLGNLDYVEHCLRASREGRLTSPAAAFRSFAHAAACEISSALRITGPVMTVTSGCNSGMDAIGLALDWIRLGRADCVLVGGTEAELTDGFMQSMLAARALTCRYNDHPSGASRPFEAERDGNVPGEGAGFLVLESPAYAKHRRKKIRAKIAGYASRAAGKRPPYDPLNPVYDPTIMVRAFRAAAADAGIEPTSISAVSANGSSSIFYDPLEAKALDQFLGDRIGSVPVHSIKSMVGQTGAVTPALQAIAAVLSIQHGVLPPTINLDRIAPECLNLSLSAAPVHGRFSHILANAIGFGGFYASALIYSEAS